jgi:hypothetical protein
MDPNTVTARHHAHTELPNWQVSSERCHLVGRLNPELAAFGRKGQCPFRPKAADVDGWSWGLAGSRGRMAAGLFGFGLPFR